MKIEEERIITNLLLLDYFDMWDEFDIKSLNDTKEARYYNLISILIDDQIDAGIRWIDSPEAEEYFKGESAYQKEVFRALEDEWDSILEGKYNSVEALLEEVYRRGKAKGYTDMREHIRYTEQDKLALEFVRDYNFGLIQRLNEDTVHQIKNTIIRGFLAGEHPYKIAPKILEVAGNRLDGSTFSPKQRAVMIARTEVSRVQNTGILQSYVNEGYTEVKILTAGDNNVCDLCLKYAFEFNEDEPIIYENHGKERTHNIIKLVNNGNFPPFHPLCRCTYLSVWSSKIEPPKNPFCVYLTPRLKTSYPSNNPYDNWNGAILNVTNKKLEKHLFGVMNENEFNDFINLISLFDENVTNYMYEWCVGLAMNGFCSEVYSNYNPKGVNLTEELIEAGLFDGLSIVIHNHLKGQAPFASHDDIATFAENRIKYGVITNDFGVFVVKNKNIEDNFNKSIKLKENMAKLEEEMEMDFLTNNKYAKNWRDSNEDKYYQELNNYIKNEYSYYLKKYEEVFEDNFEIIFVGA